jgi:uncharacterized protein (TIGR02271 family)
MPTTEEIKTWQGQDTYGPDGEKLGTIADLYLDRDTGEPEWATIKTGLFGTKVSFAPLAEAAHTAEGVRLPYTKDQIKDAPSAEADGELSQEEEAALYRHYGLSYSEIASDSGLATGEPAETTGAGGPDGRTTGTAASAGTTGGSPTTGRGPVGEDVSGPTTDEAMTRSEEELRVGTARRETGTARLRKYVVTENVTQTVPVEREEVRIEREPITDANVDQAQDGPAISEEEHEVVLHEEQPVVEKRAVPKERVRLDSETVTDEQTITEEVRKEQIEADGEDLR